MDSCYELPTEVVLCHLKISKHEAIKRVGKVKGQSVIINRGRARINDTIWSLNESMAGLHQHKTLFGPEKDE